MRSRPSLSALVPLALIPALMLPAAAGDKAENRTSTSYANVLLTVTLGPQEDPAASRSYRMLVQDGSNSEMVFGSRVPIPATTFNTADAQGGAVVPVTSFTYQTIGLTIRARANIAADGAILVRMKVESSFIPVEPPPAPPGGPVVATLNYEFQARLREGETLLAGTVDDPESGPLALRVQAKVLR